MGDGCIGPLYRNSLTVTLCYLWSKNAFTESKRLYGEEAGDLHP